MKVISMDISISKMTKDDIDGVFEIEAQSYGPHHWSKESFYNELQNNIATYYVAKNNDNKVVGFLGAWTILDESHITTIAVSPEFKRQHIGESLLLSFIEESYSKFVKYITLEVRVSNEPAINLYKKYSFKSLGTRKGYYQDNNEDALIMWTENIFSEKFKEMYNKNKNELFKQVNIICQND